MDVKRGHKIAVLTIFGHKIRLKDNRCQSCIESKGLTAAVVPIAVETIALGYTFHEGSALTMFTKLDAREACRECVVLRTFAV